MQILHLSKIIIALVMQLIMAARKLTHNLAGVVFYGLATVVYCDSKFSVAGIL